MTNPERVNLGVCLETEEGPKMTSDQKWDNILSTIGKEDARAAFEANGVTSAWFPFPKQTLKRLLNDPKAEKEFTALQELRFSSSWPDDGFPETIHLAIEDGDELFHSTKVLGEGAHGIVDEVTIATHPKTTVCVRKRIGRPNPLRAQKHLFDSFSREVHVMRQVNHIHCVRILASYTDMDFVAILSSPVADMDLATFLDQDELSDGHIDILRRGMGCLCGALNYLHTKKIR